MLEGQSGGVLSTYVAKSLLFKAFSTLSLVVRTLIKCFFNG
jgi:hypothetical protein